jgi:hypothetical protein
VTAPPVRGPQNYTVRVDCSGRVCALTVRDAPSRGGGDVGKAADGEVVSIACTTKGELVRDDDSGRESDVWLRFAGDARFISSLYAQGPPVPAC